MPSTQHPPSADGKPLYLAASHPLRVSLEGETLGQLARHVATENDTWH